MNVNGMPTATVGMTWIQLSDLVYNNTSNQTLWQGGIPCYCTGCAPDYS